MDASSYDKDKVEKLISQISSSLLENADKQELLYLAQSIVQELQHTPKIETEKKNVSVVMPANISLVPQDVSFIKETILPKKEKPTPVIVEEEPAAAQAENNFFEVWNAFGITSQAPTITYYEKKNDESKNLNENLNAPKEEVGHSLQSMPIHDLMSAIGINDRYLFINELFRGDEFMFERSIITLNKFHNYEQADSWMERELRLKLGWDKNNSFAQQFEHLVKRRFM